MQLGSTPATAVATIRASGLHPPSVVPSFRRITSRAAAPSLIPLELPAVTVPPPSGRNAGLSCASCSADTLGRGYSSLAKVEPSGKGAGARGLRLHGRAREYEISGRPRGAQL